MGVLQGDTDPFSWVEGGGYKLKSGDWVPASHSLAQQEMAAGGGTSAGSGGAGATGPGTISGQAQNASTYSTTPGAAPKNATTNQGTQDVIRNSYLAQATQGTQVDKNDPNFRQQADTFAANVERQRRDYMADQAESAGPYATGALRGQDRMSRERAGIATGTFEAELVGRELQNRRMEIQQALQGLTGMVSNDQQLALQRELAALDAELRRLGINTQARTAESDLALRRELGLGGLDLDRQRLLQQAQQFADQLGFNVADREAYWNNQATSDLLF